MKRHLLKLCAFCSLFLLTFTLSAQDLPRVSTRATTTQRVGLTKVRIEYGRPSVRGRKGNIWGELVPYDQLWRTGANEATIFSVTEEVTLNGNKLLAGRYALFTIPRKKRAWDIILTTDTTSWGTESFNSENIVLRFQAEEEKGCSDFLETMTFTLNDVTETSAEVRLRWEKVCVTFKLETDTRQQAIRNIEEAIAESVYGEWKVYVRAAEFYTENLAPYDAKAREQALDWINTALKFEKEHFRIHWVKAELLALGKDYAGAIDYGRRALRFGIEEEGEDFEYRGQLERLISIWDTKQKG
ncbi:MAG: DUF2911 domain-containing protein [Bacteroidota bacterium]